MCNGHSKCEAEAKKCDQPCQHNTEGEHCEKCAQGYFGIPVNGGQCEGNIFYFYFYFTISLGILGKILGVRIFWHFFLIFFGKSTWYSNFCKICFSHEKSVKSGISLYFDDFFSFLWFVGIFFRANHSFIQREKKQYSNYDVKNAFMFSAYVINLR